MKPILWLNGLAFTFFLFLSFLYALTQAFWLDEANTARIVLHGVAELPAQLSRDVSPPLYYLLLCGLQAVPHPPVIGLMEFFWRLPSIIFGVASLFLAYGIGRRMSVRAGNLALWLLALNPMFIWYAAEARMYTLLMCLVLAAYFLFSVARERVERWSIIALGLVLSLGCMTHYYYVFFAVVLGLAALQSFKKRAVWLLPGCAVGLVFLLWWWPIFRLQIKGDNLLLGPLSAYLNFSPLVALRETWYYFACGLGSLLPGWIMALVSIPCVGILFLGLRYKETRGLVAVFLLSLALPYVFSLFSQPIYHPKRYNSPLLPLFVLSLAVVLAQLKHRSARLLIVAFLVIAFVGCSIRQTFGYSKSLAQGLASFSLIRVGENIVCEPFYECIPVYWYVGRFLNTNFDDPHRVLRPGQRYFLLANGKAAQERWIAEHHTHRFIYKTRFSRLQASQELLEFAYPAE